MEDFFTRSSGAMPGRVEPATIARTVEPVRFPLVMSGIRRPDSGGSPSWLVVAQPANPAVAGVVQARGQRRGIVLGQAEGKHDRVAMADLEQGGPRRIEFAPAAPLQAGPLQPR